MKAKYSCVISLFLVLITFNETFGHEIRPGYLRIYETQTNFYRITWKIPKSQNKYLDLSPEFNPALELVQTEETFLVDAVLKRYEFATVNSIKGTKITIKNLERTLVDVLVQIDFLDGISHSFLLQPSEPTATIPLEASILSMIKTYFLLGVEHILLGYDHLLFVLALILIIPGLKTLIKTITSFTIAHSITLALASLGFIYVPSRPVEAIIALSIVLLAREAYSYHQGGTSLTIRHPWIVAFVFGLIHGLGFAGALSEIGLPQKSIPSALLTFNVGIEIGQVLFIVVISSVIYLIKKYFDPIKKIFDKTMPYVIGSAGSFWLIERIVGF